MRTKLDVKAAFSPAPVMSQTQRVKMLKIENSFKDLAMDIVDLVPEGPDRTAALRKLLNAKFECIQAITHPYQPQQGVHNAHRPQDDQQPQQKENDGAPEPQKP